MFWLWIGFLINLLQRARLVGFFFVRVPDKANLKYIIFSSIHSTYSLFLVGWHTARIVQLVSKNNHFVCSDNIFIYMASLLWLWLLLASLGFWSPTRAANILAVFPSDHKSHFTLARVLFTELAERGHQVCVLYETQKKRLSHPYCLDHIVQSIRTARTISQ